MGQSCTTGKKPQHKPKGDQDINERESQLSRIEAMTDEQKVKEFGPDEECEIVTEDEANKLLSPKIQMKDVVEIQNLYLTEKLDDYQERRIVLPYLRFKQSGKIYKGQWKDKQMTGYGQLYFSKGGYYCGGITNGKANGSGGLLHDNGDIYKGGFKNNSAQGRGIFISANGVKYEGEWKDDKKHGVGEFQHSYFSYKGSFKDGLKDGQGTLIINNQLKYIGYFKDDKFEGDGELFYLDNTERHYKGKFSDNMINGEGHFTWRLCYEYKGMYEKEKKHGMGEMSFNKDFVVKGKFNQGELDDSNVEIRIKDEIIIASFSKGKFVKHIKGEIKEETMNILDFSKYHEQFT